ncbi:hypothetical protein [Pseudodesulfovibrio tunisiensis]
MLLAGPGQRPGLPEGAAGGRFLLHCIRPGNHACWKNEYYQCDSGC